MKNCDEIVNDLLERREEYMKIRKRRIRKSVMVCSSVVCAFAVICLINFALWMPARKDVVGEDKANGQQYGEKNAAQAFPGGTQTKEKEDADNKEEYAVYTDSVMLPKKFDDTASYDMIACLYYKGSVYTQAGGYYEKEEVEKAKHLMGKKIGEAKGTLDEWSTQEEQSTEFASNCSGSVHKVKGYSEDFRLFIYRTEEGREWINVVENYDGIGLSTGSDLFEERLHLEGNIEKVTYQTHKDWDNGKDNFKELDKISEEEWEKFITELYESPFEAIEYEKNEDFYDAELQGHLYLQMKDGTEVVIRLIDGGYVGCQHLGWFFVKMPGEIFDKVMEACQK